jgi:alkylation response protein AidB-like acyl-CoA dehydrogenase
MHFSLTPDQVAFAEAVRDLLAAQCPPAAVRSRSGAVWDHLAATGLFGAAVPEAQGGLGLSDVDLVPVLMELGYAAVPHPVAETAAVAGPALAALGDDRLDDLVAGRLRVAVAGPSGLAGYGADADLVLAFTDEGVRRRPPGTHNESTVDLSRPVARVAVEGPVTDDGGLVRDRFALATAAQLVGLGRRMLDLTTSYVVTRRQFGVPVGSFQAVKHRLADALLRLEFAAPAVLAAGWELSRRTATVGRAVSLAAVLARDAATEVAQAAIQAHGAIGYTVEYDLHLYAKRAWALAAELPVDEHLDRLAAELDVGGAHV